MIQSNRTIIQSIGFSLAILLVGNAWAATVGITPMSESLPLGYSRNFATVVSGLTDTSVSWSVNGIPGGDATVGTIDSMGKYTAPQALPSINPVTVTATASDHLASASATVTVRLPRPLISSASPNPVPLGTYTTTITGSRFYPSIVATVNGQPVTLQYVSPTQVVITGAANTQGTANVVLWNASNADSTVFSLCFSLCSTSTPPPSSGNITLQPAPTADPADVAAARFLEQASFGPDSASLARVKQIGVDSWLDEQFALPESPIPNQSQTPIGGAWFSNMAHGQDQLRQRVLFALSQIFVVSMNKNTTTGELDAWVRLLSKNVFPSAGNTSDPLTSPGNFYQLMREVTLSPTMGKYLDLANSVRPTTTTAANENYARELLQLFTIGLVQLNQDGTPKVDENGRPLATYDQSTIQQLALALTGWTYPTAPGATPRTFNPQYFVGTMEPRDTSHDRTAKTLFGGTPYAVNLASYQTTQAELDSALRAVFYHPNVPPFIATRLIRSLVTSNPSPTYISHVAGAFIDNGQGIRGDLKAVVKAVLTDPEARNTPTTNQGRLKDPVGHMLGFTRAMGATLTDPNLFQWELGLLGEKVLDPSSVFSYFSPLYKLPDGSGLLAPEFQIYTPSQAILRANLFWELISGQAQSAYQNNIAPFVNVASDPNVLINMVNTVLFQGRMSPELRQTLFDTALPYTDLTRRAQTVLYLAVISSEYAIQR